jgi:ketosteroid isomerase-like protein
VIAAPQSAQAPQPSVALPPELARVLRDYERAWSARDPQALAALFAEDGYVLARGRPPVRGRAQIALHYAGSGGPLSLRAFAYATDGGTGYIIGGYTGQSGEPDAGKFTLTLRREGDRWLIVSDMDNANAGPDGSGSPADLDAIMRKATGDWNSGDLDAFVAPYHPDATFMTPRGPVGRTEMRAAYEKNYFAGGKPKQQLAYEQLSTVPLGPDTALMTGRFVLTGGGEKEQTGWFTLVWVRTPAGWQIIRDHTS